MRTRARNGCSLRLAGGPELRLRNRRRDDLHTRPVHRLRLQVSLDLRGDGGVFDLTVESTLPPSTARNEVLRERVQLGNSPLRRSLRLADGFHIVVLRPVGGTHLFLAQVGTTTLDGGPAAFLGGAVVGGYLSGGLSGCAAVCPDDSSAVHLRTLARSTRGAIGAGDLRLRLLDGHSGALLYDSENAP